MYFSIAVHGWICACSSWEKLPSLIFFICKISCLYPQTTFCGQEISRYLLVASALNQPSWFIINNGCPATNINGRWISPLVTKIILQSQVFNLHVLYLKCPAMFYYKCVFLCIFLITMVTFHCICNIYSFVVCCGIWFIFTFFAFIPSLDTERVLPGKEFFQHILF